METPPATSKIIRTSSRAPRKPKKSQIPFALQLGDNRFYKKLMKEPLTYVTRAVLLAVFQIAHVALLNSGWGVTSAFATWGAWVYEAIGGSVQSKIGAILSMLKN